MISEPYIRKKGNRYIIERKLDGRTEYIKTLPNVRELLVLLGVEASRYYEEATQQKEQKASSSEKRPNESLESQDEQDPKVRIRNINRTHEKDASDSSRIHEDDPAGGEEGPCTTPYTTPAGDAHKPTSEELWELTK